MHELSVSHSRPAFGLSARNFEPFTPPDPLDPLGIDQPARVTQQRCNLAIAIASVLASQCDDVGGQPLFVVPARRRLALLRSFQGQSCGTLEASAQRPLRGSREAQCRPLPAGFCRVLQGFKSCRLRKARTLTLIFPCHPLSAAASNTPRAQRRAARGAPQHIFTLSQAVRFILIKPPTC